MKVKTKQIFGDSACEIGTPVRSTILNVVCKNAKLFLTEPLSIFTSGKRIKQLDIFFAGARPLVNYNFPGSMPL